MTELEDETQVDVKFENGVWTRKIEPPGDGWRIFGQTLLERMKKVPERIGQIDGLTGKEDTYASMVDRAVRCALWLKKQGVKPGDFIGISTHNHLDTFVPVLAAIFTGVVFYPWWDVGLDDDMVAYFLKLGEPRVMFVNQAVAEIVQKGINDLGTSTKVVVFEDSPGWMTLHNILREQDAEEVKNFKCTIIEDMEQSAVMMFTSGTTGYPKGVLHSYSWLEKCSYLAEDKYVADNSILWFAGICWISGVGCTINSIKNCATAIIYQKASAEMACQLIEKYKIKCLVMGTSIANHLYKYKDVKNHDLSSVKYVLFGGVSATEEVDRNMTEVFPKAGICLGYGMTEVGVLVGRDDLSEKFCSSGKIRKNCQIKVVDLNIGEPLGVKEQGEICFKSPYMMLRYHKNPKSTQEAIDADGWYHSGDLGYYDAEGDFFVIDRMRELIKYKQLLPVVPLVIEEVILKHPSIVDVGVVAKPDLIDVELPMAFITTRTGSNVTEEEIIKYVEDNLPDHMRLRGGVKILKEMPTTPSGKISKKHLREMAKVLANA